MKKRLFRMLLMLCLLVAALTLAVSAVQFGAIIDPESDSSPSTYISLTGTVSPNPGCVDCSGNVGKGLTVISIQYPVNGNYHKLALTVNIPEYTCSTCKTKTGPFNNLTVEFSTSNNEYFCHSSNYTNNTGNKIIKLTSSVPTTSNGNIEFEILAYPRNFGKLSSVHETDATCTTGGISQDCFYCNICDKYFTDEAGTNEITTPVVLPALGHDFDTTTGKCRRCDHRATASLNDVFKESLAAAVADYNSGRGGTLRAFISPEKDESFTLKKSGKLIVPEGVTIPKIILEDNPTVTIENSGTINAIEMNQPGALTIENSGEIASINTSIVKSGDGSRTISVMNHSAGVINEIKAPNATLTVRNDGKIKSLIGYFYQDMVKLQRGSGPYTKIVSMQPIFNDTQLGVKTINFVTCLNAEDDYFYFPDESNVERKWVRSNFYKTEEQHTLNNVYISGLPIASIGVTGKADESPIDITQDGNTFSMTVDVGRTVTLTGAVVLPEQGLKSEKLDYSWYCSTTGERGTGETFQFANILFGEYDLRLTVTDNQYHHSRSVNIHINAQQGDQKTPLFLKQPTMPTEGFFERSYNGTDGAPYGLRSITFYTTGDREITVDKKYYDFTIRYPSPNCTGDDPVNITATVWLTDDGKEHFTLGTDGTATFTVPGKITQVSADYKISTEKTGQARVGDRIFTRFALETNFYNKGYQYRDFLSPDADMMAGDEPLSITFYRLHPGNIIKDKADTLTAGSDFISDPELDELLTKDSVFKYAGKYYIYAVVQPTTNYKGEITNCRVINVQDTETSSAHHKDYDGGWDGTGTVPIAANKSKSFYLSGSYSTIYTELLLSQGKKLTLCLNGKTLSATKSITSFDQIRVTGGAKLTIDDCTETGTVKGTVVSSGWGGIAYVKNGTLTIKHGKFTGGTASTGGGAIVVEAGGTLIIDGGEISGNTVTGGDGGAIYIKSGGTVNMYGGTITNNHVYSGNGGAIYVENGATLNLYGGEITGNTASTLGGGIYVEKGGELNVQGAPVVTGNTAGGKDSNVYLAGGQILTADKLGADAKIGISVEALSYPALFATSTADYSAHFIPDDADTFVLRTNGGLTLAAKPSATRSGTELTVTTGDKYAPDACILFVAEYDKDNRMLAVQSKDITPDSGTYTFKVQTSSAAIKCFLLRKGTYTPLFEAFTPQ